MDESRDVTDMKSVHSVSTENRLWITEDYFCRFDENGRILAMDTYEGALGYVIKLYNDNHDELEYAALKIPKLVGSTHRENAYINDLMFQEEKTVSKIRRAESSGLLSVIQSQVLRGPLRFQSREKLAHFDNGLMFAKFEAGKPPIILIRQEDGTLYPEPNDDNSATIRTFIANLSIDEIRNLTAVENGNGKEYWKKTVFLAKKPSLGKSGNFEYLPFSEVTAAAINPADDTWYACLPSVIYTWAYGTLQEVISSEDIGKAEWTPLEHLQLAYNICMGLEELHNRNYVHADVRPANILYTDQDVNNLMKYLLADYGSLAIAPQEGGGKGEDSGETVLGPVFEGERTSVFYAPERYKGQEREIANRAVILKSPQGYVTHVVLGWQKKLNKENAEAAVEKARTMVSQDLSAHESRFEDNHIGDSEAKLQAGDRVRIQDYIFQLTGTEQQVDGLFILPCDNAVSKMSQGRIAVRQDDHTEIPEDLPADRTIEMLQWSAATDIYSLGILLLYSIYRNSYADPEEKYRLKQKVFDEKETTEVELKEYSQEQNEKELEDSFRRMVIYLSNPQFFELIWRDLDSLRLELEVQLGKEGVNFDIAERPYPSSKYTGNIEFSDPEADEKKNLREQSIDVTNIFTQLVPGARRLCASLDFNLAAFVFIMHFVMACIHRRKHLTTKLDWMDPNLPFCESRIETPRRNGPAKQARLRLERLRDIFAQFDNDSLRGFQIALANDESSPKIDLDEKILPLSSDTDFNIRQQKITLEKQNGQLETQIRYLESILNEINAEYTGYKASLFGRINLSRMDKEILAILAQYEENHIENTKDTAKN